MTREEALDSLTSGNNHERLKAARFLNRMATADDLAALTCARRNETVSYVKVALDRAITKLTNRSPAPEQPSSLDESNSTDGVTARERKKAVEWISGLLLHEIGSGMGRVRLSAAREIQNFESSKTKRLLDAMNRRLEAIELLREAAGVPKPNEFDLSELLSEIIAHEITVDGSEISLLGPRPMLIVSDPALVSLAVGNGIRNALEAVEAVNGLVLNAAHPVVVTWGQTDIDYWVSVIDKGIGIIGPIEPAFEVGKTTKADHIGFGLAIARQAVETLGGTLTLQPATGGGTRFEARWER